MFASAHKSGATEPLRDLIRPASEVGYLLDLAWGGEVAGSTQVESRRHGASVCAGFRAGEHQPTNHDATLAGPGNTYDRSSATKSSRA